MAKTKPLTLAERLAELRLGDSITVITPHERLMNNEVGAPFAPNVPTPQTVTTTALRRLQDGDLQLADPVTAPAAAPAAA